MPRALCSLGREGEPNCPACLPPRPTGRIEHDPPDCVFCEIVAGRSPASAVYGGRTVLGLLPRRPITEGHALVIPMAHIERMHEVLTPTVHEIISVLAGVANAMNLRDYNILQITGLWSSGGESPSPSETIRHVHFHLIPRKKGDGIRLNANHGRVLSKEELDRIARDIRSRLRHAGF